MTLGIAVEVSGIKGLFAAELAWTAVLVGLSLLGVSAMRSLGITSRRPGRQPRRKPPLDRALEHLGREIVAFINTRDVDAPGWDSSESTLRHPVRASRIWRAVRAYEQDTMIMYRQRFLADVKRLVHEVAGVGLGPKEARNLLNPRDVFEAEVTGRRLVEIAEALRARRNRRAA